MPGRMSLLELLSRLGLCALAVAVCVWLTGCAGRVTDTASHGETCEIGADVGLVAEGEPPDTTCSRMAGERGAAARWCCLTK